jgi:ATP-dependent DNA helicase RecG
MAPQALDLLQQKYLHRDITDVEMQRIEKLEYLEAAIREALMNAIVHKFYGGTTIQISVYPDQLMIWNPGGLPKELTIQELKQKHASHPRNKILANLFFQAGYIETWSRGIPAILESCRANKLPEPEMKHSSGGFEISFVKDRLTKTYLTDLDLSERQLRAVQHLKKEKKIQQSLPGIERNYSQHGYF